MALSQFGLIDEYGFERDEEFDSEMYEKFYSSYLKVLMMYEKKWNHYLKDNHNLKRSLRLKFLIRHGIPNGHRSYVWFTVSGALDYRNKDRNRFPMLLSMVEHNKNVSYVIKEDLPRTFPDNIRFNSNQQYDYRQDLLHVLSAFAEDNKVIGYCQGMNYIAGTLLLITSEEDSTFWLLKTLIEKILPQYYSRNLSGLMVDIEVLSALIKIKFPDLHVHLERLGVELAVVCTKWFICLYIDTFPFETVLRIWDCLFYEGSKILFRVALTLFAKFHLDLMACSDLSAVVDCFRNIYKSAYVLDCHYFLKDIFKLPGHLSNRTIDKLREQASRRLKL